MEPSPGSYKKAKHIKHTTAQATVPVSAGERDEGELSPCSSHATPQLHGP